MFDLKLLGFQPSRAVSAALSPSDDVAALLESPSQSVASFGHKCVDAHKHGYKSYQKCLTHTGYEIYLDAWKMQNIPLA
jgi:hypothetical protein